MGMTRDQALKEMQVSWEAVFRGKGLPDTLRFVNGVVVSKDRWIATRAAGVDLRWLNFYEVRINGCVGKKIIIGDE